MAVETQPRAKYEDVKGHQRVGADVGTAYPVDPQEIQPQPAVEHVKQGPNRTGAELGYATPVDPKETQPAKRYEDETGPQRVGADTGQAEPIAKGSARAQEEVKDSSVSKAQGATVPKAGRDKVKGRTRPSAGDPVKPAAKRAVAKGKTVEPKA